MSLACRWSSYRLRRRSRFARREVPLLIAPFHKRRANISTAQKTQQSKPAASWVLESNLSTPYHDPSILSPSAAPTSADESAYTAIYTILVTLIRLSGGSLPAAKIDRYLRRMGMEDNTPVSSYTKTELLIKRMEKEGYLVKIKESIAGQDDDISWMVGPRGRTEVSDGAVRGIVKDVYGQLDKDEAKELERRVGRSLALGEQPDKAGEQNGEKQKKKGRRRTKDVQQEEDDEDDEEVEEEDE